MQKVRTAGMVVNLLVCSYGEENKNGILVSCEPFYLTRSLDSVTHTEGLN